MCSSVGAPIAHSANSILDLRQPAGHRRIQVTALLSAMCLFQRTACVVRAQHAEATGLVFHEPDVAVAEHGVGCFEELNAEVCDIVEGGLDLVVEPGVSGWVGLDAREGLEEEGVVIGLGGEVEEDGVRGVAGVLAHEIMGS